MFKSQPNTIRSSMASSIARFRRFHHFASFTTTTHSEQRMFYVIALHEISRCIKFDEARQERRQVELRPINDENANEILEKNMRERKAKMETLNVGVADIIQDLFDFLYKTLPNKCNWNGNHIEFPDMKMSINEPYRMLNVNRTAHGFDNKSVKYVETQLLTFWQKHDSSLVNKQKKNKKKKQKKNTQPQAQPQQPTQPVGNLTPFGLA